MNGKMRSSVMGLILSLFSSPLPEAQKEPVAYLYNGVRLPPLPEWDKTVYPYAMIDNQGLFNNDLYYCYFLPEKPSVVYQPDNPTLKWYQSLPAHFLESAFDESANEWGELKTITTSYNRSAEWANFDVINADGSVFLHASEPVPVYE